MMAKSREAFRTISEVAEWLGVQAHVLRFWESKFAQVKPVKRAGGRRYYRPADMLLLGGIKKLLHDDGMTIKGVQKVLREQGVSYVADHSPSLDDLTIAQLDGEVANLKGTLEETVLPLENLQAADLPSEGETEETLADEAAVSVEPDVPEVVAEVVVEEEVASLEPDPPEDEAESEAEVISLEPDLPDPETEVEPVQSETPAIVEPIAAEPIAEILASPEPTPEESPEIASAEPDADQQEEAVEAPQQPEPEPAVSLPSFMHKRVDPAPMTKVPRVVDAPDGPSEDQIEVPPGLLARLSKLDRVPASQIDNLRAVQAQLETLHTRLSGTGKE